MDAGLLEVALVAAAVLIGATGTWSPCGFSMIETIGPRGHTGGRRVTLAACATFLPGALFGGLATFGTLALLGSVLPAGDWLRYGAASAVALAAAVAEARGARLVPQIRRQLPEHWRRAMPMPLAAALYGTLLGLGFTTFVLTFGVWALAAVALALGDPVLGVAVGLGFGVGRALPIVTLAPIADRPAGRAAVTLMADRPGLYRGIRMGDAGALVLVGASLIFAGAAEATVKRVDPGADPSVSGGELVNQRGKARAAELHDESGAVIQLPGTDPAIGGGYVAVIDGSDVVLLDRQGLQRRDRITVPGADALALDRDWLAIRTRIERRDAIQLRRISPNGRLGDRKEIADVVGPRQLGRPTLGGGRLAYAVAKRSRNRLVLYGLTSGKRRAAVSSRVNALSNPALFGGKMVYVRTTRRRNQLRLLDLGDGGQRTLRSGRARYWSTALDRKRAYLTLLEGRKPRPRIVSVRR